MFGLEEDKWEYKEQLEKALALLREVGQKKKTAKDVVGWLQETYPDVCHACGTKGQHDDVYCAGCSTKLEHPAPKSVREGGEKCGYCFALNQPGPYCTKCSKKLE